MQNSSTTNSQTHRVLVLLSLIASLALLLGLSGAAADVTDSPTDQLSSSSLDPETEPGATLAQAGSSGLSVETTSVSVDAIGVVQDTGSISISATGITQNGAPVDGDAITFTVGNEVVTTATVTDGTATATFDPTTLQLSAGQASTIGVVEGTVETPGRVELVHEILPLDAGLNPVSIPQAGEIVTERVSTLTVWNSEEQTYETVTDTVFDAPGQLNSGVYVTAEGSDARLGVVFDDQTPAPGVASLRPGWNFVGSNFAVDAPDEGGTRAIDTDLAGIDASSLTLFDAELRSLLSPDTEINAYQPYWAFVGSQTSIDRPIVQPSYNRGDRLSVVGNGAPNGLVVTNSAPANVTAGETVSITATVENPAVTARQDAIVALSIENTVIQTQTISIGDGKTQPVSFTVDTATLGVTAGTTVEHTVSVATDKDTATIDIEPGEQIDDLALDSVSSLLNENEQPLTDESVIAVSAAPTAINEDTDGNGDAVSYPSETDIPVVAVDNNVVGITGPFAASDTDFANFGNEELLLNIYDSLLGGSGTIVHDEGHGQFYTLAPNGGDDFQAFGEYARENGYQYTATSDLTAELDAGSADAVVITSPSEALTQSELDALANFTDSGGVVVLHDQSDFNNFDATDNHNAIASALDAEFRFNDDQVVDDQSNTGARFVPVTGNFNTDTFSGLFADRSGLGVELSTDESYQVEVTEVTDGDTVDVRFSNFPTEPVDTVRIVGIDTPETGSTDERIQEYEGIDNETALKTLAEDGGAIADQGASTYAQSQLAGKTVTLSFDDEEGLRGNFGRLLGFLELSDGSVYNREIVRDGWARVYDSGFAQHDEYLDLEQEARANSRGIWQLSDPAATPETGDDPVDELFFPEPVAVTGPSDAVPVRSEAGEPLVALDTDANVAAIGGPLIEEGFEASEGGPGIDQYGVYPFLTNVIDTLSADSAAGPVVVDAGHGQFASDFAVSAEDTAYYLRYLEGQSTNDSPFIGLEGTVDLASDAGPDLVENGSPTAHGVIISTPATELTAPEQTAITEFANAGGAVILLGSAANGAAVTNFDPLLTELGTDVGFTTTPVTDADNNLAGDSTVPTTTNFTEIQSGELFTPFTETTTPVSVGGLTPTDASVLAGEQFTVEATVTNNGTATAQQSIELRLEPDGSPVAQQTVAVSPGESTTVSFADVSVDQAGQFNHTVASATDQATGTLTVATTVDTIVLDSISSLLNENGQPLTDDSTVAVEAEPTATTVDADGNGDNVTYPSDTDIPVVAVDDTVVGITGPFVQEDDFINYTDFGNDEFLLNLYDDLLGGSGTILHDEGHDQFYDVASVQSFANTVRSSGYSYQATTDLASNLTQADAVVITTPSSAFTQSELDALTNFTVNGGVVILHDQSDNNDFDATANHNEIAEALDATFRFNDDQVEDAANNNGVPFSPITDNFNFRAFSDLFDARAGIGDEGSETP